MFRQRLALLLLSILLCSLIPSPTFADAEPFKLPFHQQSIWNSPIPDRIKLHPASDRMIKLLVQISHSTINIDGINGLWSVPVYYADSNTRPELVCDANGDAPCEPVPMPPGMVP